MLVRPLPITEFLDQSSAGVVLDVRSPAEYVQGHIPGAISFPLFTDAERKEVGTLYKQEGRAPAIEKGLELVGPKLAAFVKHAKEHAAGKPLFVHCWRGGMRSGSMAWLLATAGMKVYTLEGGYKSYRRQVIEALAEPFQLIVLGGETGSGKTDVLQALQQKGEQVIDLEAMAHHKGSSFGSIGQQQQPSTEHFANLLFDALCKMDRNKPVWIEDESRMIGAVHIDPPFFKTMSEAPLVVMQVPQAWRVKRLVLDYGKADKLLLKAAFERIRKKLGGQHVITALEAIEEHDLATAAVIALRYYDKAYRFGLECKTNKVKINFEPQKPDVMHIADELIQLAKEKIHTWNQSA